jgi:hypothetical protein
LSKPVNLCIGVKDDASIRGTDKKDKSSFTGELYERNSERAFGALICPKEVVSEVHYFCSLYKYSAWPGVWETDERSSKAVRAEEGDASCMGSWGRE